eukprot:COSAG04_NODE_1406_length_6889_cov_235.285272_5_plen_120_part_00
MMAGLAPGLAPGWKRGLHRERVSARQLSGLIGFCSFAGTFFALNTGEWVGGVIAKGGQGAQGGWVVARTSPCRFSRTQPQKHPKKLRLRRKALHWPRPLLARVAASACVEDEAARPQHQ